MTEGAADDRVGSAAARQKVGRLITITGVASAARGATARALWDTTITFDDQYKSDENFSKLVFNLLQAV